MGAGHWPWVHVALVPWCPLVAEDVMGGTEHHHVGEVVAETQDPEARCIPPMRGPIVPPRGLRLRVRLLPPGIRAEPLRARTASHGLKRSSPEEPQVGESSGLAPTGRVRVFKNERAFRTAEQRVAGSRDSPRGSPITCAEVLPTSGSFPLLSCRLPLGGKSAS